MEDSSNSEETPAIRKIVVCSPSSTLKEKRVLIGIWWDSRFELSISG